MKSVSEHRDLLQRLSEGDESAYSLFFNHYYTILWPVVIRFTKSSADAEEVMQEVFLRVWLYRDRLPAIEDLDAWLYKVCSRECLTFLRKRAPQYNRLAGLAEAADASDSRFSSPLEAMHFDEMSKAIAKAVEAMPAQRKRIYILSRTMGMKPADIAEELSLSVGTVKNVLSRSLKEIREFLIQSGFDLLLSGLVCLRIF